MIDGHVALPCEPPEWLPEGIVPAVHLTENSASARLRWEQRVLLRLANNLGVELVHTTTSSPPLFSSRESFVSPAGYGDPRRMQGFISRLREAVSQGGMARASGLLWPEDIPMPEGEAPITLLPPIVYGDSLTVAGTISDHDFNLHLPENYLLYHGPTHQEVLMRVMGAWSWAAKVIGEYTPLLLLVRESVSENVRGLAGEYGLGESVLTLSPTSPQEVLPIYEKCTALFHPAPVSPWGGAVRRAMIYGNPIVGMESLAVDAMVSAGAFLVDGKDTRAMGAALITIVVNDEVAEKLSQVARERAMNWGGATYGDKLLDVYLAALSSP
jgi:glycosyltransferase involved in cell wall biosynthesis